MALGCHQGAEIQALALSYGLTCPVASSGSVIGPRPEPAPGQWVSPTPNFGPSTADPAAARPTFGPAFMGPAAPVQLSGPAGVFRVYYFHDPVDRRVNVLAVVL